MDARSSITDVLTLQIIEQWLAHAERRVKAVNESGFKMLLDEGNVRAVSGCSQGWQGTSFLARCNTRALQAFSALENKMCV